MIRGRAWKHILETKTQENNHPGPQYSQHVYGFSSYILRRRHFKMFVQKNLINKLEGSVMDLLRSGHFVK